ncbi:hydroxyisourate hydrolase [Niallia sp. 03133]|uniref:hydroxyisourate hydrolase n=1 Tax=Niallia sp. 03133 TaxID=3458060 RepID=UPI0040447917
MKTGITTHVLDLANGKPANNIKVELWRWEQTTENHYNKVFIASGLTNDDGRVDSVLLDTIETGEYELLFFIENYFNDSQLKDGRQPFLRTIPLRFFADSSETHYHVPLLLSPWGYQTYRGS